MPHPFRLSPGRGLLIAVLLAATSSARARADQSVPAAQLESFLGLPSESLTDLGNGPAVNGSGLWTALLVNAGDVLSFRYNFLTDEVADLGNTINDFAFIAVAGQPTPFADVISGPSLASSSGFAFETGYRTFSYTFQDAGSFLFGVGVVNVTDDRFDSGLLIDQFALQSSPTTNGGFESGDFTGFRTIGDARVVRTFGGGPPDGNFQALISTRAVPEPSSLALLALGSAAGLARLRARFRGARTA